MRELKLKIVRDFSYTFGRTSQEVRELKSDAIIFCNSEFSRTSQEVRELKLAIITSGVFNVGVAPRKRCVS